MLELREKISGNLLDKNKEILSEFMEYFENKLENTNKNNENNKNINNNNKWLINDNENSLLK